jgi:hypothetical protein
LRKDWQSWRRLVRLNSRFGLFHSNTFRLPMVWPIRELMEPLITIPDIAIGNLEESRSSARKASHDGEKRHFLRA